MSGIEVSSAEHVCVVEWTPGRYPYRAVCPCGWVSRGYVAAHAAETMADAHMSTGTYTLHTVTVGECGSSHGVSVPGRYRTRADAMIAATAHGDTLAGPVMDGYRRPTVTVVDNDIYGTAVQVGSADIDSSYTIIYVSEG